MDLDELKILIKKIEEYNKRFSEMTEHQKLEEYDKRIIEDFEHYTANERHQMFKATFESHRQQTIKGE